MSSAIMDRLLHVPYDGSGMIESISYSLNNAYYPSEVNVTIPPHVDLCDAMHHLSNSICDAADEPQDAKPQDTKPKKVFADGPVVGVIWSDGKKTMTRCHEDDKFSLNFGLMNNYLRKVTNNRGKYDTKWDDAACGAVAIAEMLGTPGEMRDAAKMLEFLADALEILGGAE